MIKNKKRFGTLPTLWTLLVGYLPLRLKEERYETLTDTIARVKNSTLSAMVT